MYVIIHRVILLNASYSAEVTAFTAHSTQSEGGGSSEAVGHCLGFDLNPLTWHFSFFCDKTSELSNWSVNESIIICKQTLWAPCQFVQTNDISIFTSWFLCHIVVTYCHSPFHRDVLKTFVYAQKAILQRKKE